MNNDKQQRTTIFESLNKFSYIQIQLYCFFFMQQALDEREEFAVIHLKCNDETSQQQAQKTSTIQRVAATCMICTIFESSE